MVWEGLAMRRSSQFLFLPRAKCENKERQQCIAIFTPH